MPQYATKLVDGAESARYIKVEHIRHCAFGTVHRNPICFPNSPRARSPATSIQCKYRRLRDSRDYMTSPNRALSRSDIR